jgi:hypothetical protein
MPLYGSNTSSKPAQGTLINWGAPLAPGLLWLGGVLESSGSVLADSVSQAPLTINAAASWGASNPSSPMGSGLKCATTNAGAQVALPKYLQLQAPVTLVVGFQPKFAGISPTSGSYLLGLFLNNTGASQFLSFGIRYDSISDLGLISCASGGINVVAGLPYIAGQDYVMAAVFNPGGYVIYVTPVGGTPLAPVTGNWVNSPLTSTYASSALLGMGAVSGNTGSPNSLIYFGALYNRALSQVEANLWGSNPWQIYRTRGWLMTHASSTAPEFRRTLYNRTGSRGVA